MSGRLTLCISVISSLCLRAFTRRQNKELIDLQEGISSCVVYGMSCQTDCHPAAATLSASYIFCICVGVRIVLNLE